MIHLAIFFLILAIVSGLLGFSGVEIISINIARTLFAVFLVLFIASFIVRLLRGR